MRGWLKAGIFEDGEIFPSEAGTPQGGIVSPLLANVALHGLETALTTAFPKKHRVAVIRFADDFVILSEDLETLQSVRTLAETWLAEIGLTLKPSKTYITHTLHIIPKRSGADEHEGRAGFDFLRFSVRQLPVGKHHSKRGYKVIIKPSKKAQKPHPHSTREQPNCPHYRLEPAHPGLDELPPRLLCQANLQSHGSPASLEAIQMGQMAKPPQKLCLAETTLLAA